MTVAGTCPSLDDTRPDHYPVLRDGLSVSSARTPTMRALVQRVSEASVTVDGDVVGAIDAGLCVLVGVSHEDVDTHAAKLADKLWNLRIFEDEKGHMNLSCADTAGQLLVISQFTLYGETSKGRRPSFVSAARPEHAEPLIAALIDELRARGARVECGRFRADMKVALVNDGPVTLMLEV